MNYILSLSDLQKIARKMAIDGGLLRKEVKLSTKPDYVDCTLQQAEKLVKKLQRYQCSQY